MRKLLNTLYITSPKSYLSLDGENIVILKEDDQKFRIPFTNIENIVCFGYMGASPALMGKCVNNNIGLSFLKPNGKFLAKVIGKTKGSVFLRQIQYEKAKDDSFCLEFSKNIVSAKLYNTRSTINRTLRDNVNLEGRNQLIKVSDSIKDNIENVYDFSLLDEIRGFEGTYAKQYFSVFYHMILNQKKAFSFDGRNKRPPLDNVNCMISYLYIILGLEVESALETVGLDPYVGFMHKLRAGRASLSLDLIEEFRAYLVDRLVISMINLKKILPKHFQQKEGGGILMTDEGRRIILNCWQEKKKEIIKHPYINEKIEIGLLPYVQAQLLARYLRDDIAEYPQFLFR